ncbi:MAG: hypothetical protein A2156_10365 [Deltaproteobacteria bacterium RBG_16_48_10]|nr:MAG: hypothetical protein A2156_10365 [Deltaproteobacteria bacterium RBG_16_48_10]
MMKKRILKETKGLSLIELLVALGVSSILMAGLYRTYIGQQRAYTVEDQVVDMQQNVRVSVGQMMREVRMAGYGGNILTAFGNVNGFTNIITPVYHANNVGTNDDSITIIIAEQVSKLNQNAAKNSSDLDLNNPGSIFNTGTKKYLCLNGANNYSVQSISGNTVTLATSLAEDHFQNEPVFLVKAITYKLQWDQADPTMPVLVEDEHTGGGSQVIAENIERLQFHYTLSDGSVTDTPADPKTIQMISVDITARTKMPDPQLPGDGYRRRPLSSSVKVINLSL